MKICAYLTVCLCLPFVLLAEDEGAVKEKPSPDENAEAAEAVVDSGFERFKTVLDRMPFGRPPPGFNPDAPGGSGDGRQDPGAAAEAAAAAEASEAEQKLVSSVRVSMLNRTADGRVFVGFTDSSFQPARNYMLELGEKREQCEWQVVSADPDNRQVTLSKGGVEVALKVGGGGGAASGDKDGKPKDGGHGDKPGMPLRMPPGLAQGRPPMMPPGARAAAGGGEGKLSGLEIARMRRKERLEREMADKEQQRQAAEQAKKEREQEKREREVAAEERKEQLAQLMQIQEELRRQREEKAQREAAAAEAAAAQQGEEQPQAVE